MHDPINLKIKATKNFTSSKKKLVKFLPTHALSSKEIVQYFPDLFEIVSYNF